MTRLRTLAALALLLAGCTPDDTPPAPRTMSIGAELRQCIERAQASDKAGQYAAGAAWWREAGRVTYGQPDCREDAGEVFRDRSTAGAGG